MNNQHLISMKTINWIFHFLIEVKVTFKNTLWVTI